MTRAHAASVGVGDVIAGRYRLDGVLGHGGMGRVFAATDQSLGRAVAVKVMLPQVSARPSAAERFQREARVGATVCHPNIVHTLDHGEDRGVLYIVLERLEGTDLNTLTANSPGPLAIELAVAIAEQTARALAAAHSHDLIHRDLKPENILIAADGDGLHVRLIDFGLAFIDRPDAEDLGRLTQRGTPGGTPYYIAPEILRDQPITAACDIYSLGCVLFEALCDRVPFQADSLGELFALHMYAPIPDCRQFQPDAPSFIAELVMQMMAKRPAQRPTAANMLRRLEHYLRPTVSSRHPVVTEDPTGDMSPAPGFRIGVAAGAPAQVLIALASAGMEAVPVEGELPEGLDVVIAVHRSIDEVSALVAQNVQVLADADPNDMERVTGLLRVGASDVLARPLRPEQVVRKIRRLRICRRAKGPT